LFKKLKITFGNLTKIFGINQHRSKLIRLRQKSKMQSKTSIKASKRNQK